ncbi:MAG: phosphatidylinositol transfer protein [Sandaracinaceae bacterium]|nr:phosphatidylinositol transfer protein [Sandaracinaceae bacterium]
MRSTLAWVFFVALGVGCGSGIGGGGDSGTSADASADAGETLDAGLAPDAGLDRDAGPAPDGGSLAPDASLECALAQACDGPLPPFGATRDWRHTTTRLFTILQGDARHRGRDLYLREGEPQWGLAKFTYGLADDDLKDEEVDVFLERDCGGAWESLGTVRTTDDGDHATVLGVEDTGGRVYLDLSSAGVTLPVGRHRLLYVVAGDHSTATQIVEILPAGARFVVTDVDGTQTESETAEWVSLLTGSGPAAQPSGAALLEAFARRGYHLLYLTARPDWLDPRTHQWLADNGYPPGIVHTTLTFTGALNAAAQTFKEEELALLAASFPGGLYVAIGNTDSDIGAYATAGVPPALSWSYQHDPGAIGTRVDDYGTRIAEVEALPPLCR